MTLEQAIDRYTNNAEYERIHGSLQGCLDFRQLAEWLKDYKRLLEQEPCDDAIDRAEAMTEIMMFAGNVKSDEEDVYIKVSDAVQLLRELPPANLQEPKTGHWIDHQEDRWIYAQCSECGTVHDTQTNYCPNCGCRMVEPQESEEQTE